MQRLRVQGPTKRPIAAACCNPKWPDLTRAHAADDINSQIGASIHNGLPTFAKFYPTLSGPYKNLCNRYATNRKFRIFKGLINAIRRLQCQCKKSRHYLANDAATASTSAALIEPVIFARAVYLAKFGQPRESGEYFTHSCFFCLSRCRARGSRRRARGAGRLAAVENAVAIKVLGSRAGDWLPRTTRQHRQRQRATTWKQSRSIHEFSR